MHVVTLHTDTSQLPCLLIRVCISIIYMYVRASPSSSHIATSSSLRPMRLFFGLSVRDTSVSKTNMKTVPE